MPDGVVAIAADQAGGGRGGRGEGGSDSREDVEGNDGDTVTSVGKPKNGERTSVQEIRSIGTFFLSATALPPEAMTAPTPTGYRRLPHLAPPALSVRGLPKPPRTPLFVGPGQSLLVCRGAGPPRCLTGETLGALVG